MRRLLPLLMLLASTGWAVAGDAKKPLRSPPNGTPGVEKKDAGAVLPSRVVEKRVEKLNDQVHWFTSLDEAKAAAREQKKPIFWLHVLGEIDGEC
jgi:hypothetical protein